MQFKKGDRVRVTKNFGASLYNKYIGQTATVFGVFEKNKYPYVLNIPSFWSDNELQKVPRGRPRKGRGFREFREFLADECSILKKYKAGKYDRKIYDWFKVDKPRKKVSVVCVETKEQEVEIIQISATGGESSDVFGLGTDNKVYVWASDRGEWMLEI